MNERVNYVGAVTGRLRRDDTAYADHLLGPEKPPGEDVYDLPEEDRISTNDIVEQQPRLKTYFDSVYED